MLSSKLVILTTVLGICLADTRPIPMRTPDKYVFIPVPFPANFWFSDFTGYISFAVQTCNDAYLALSTGMSTSQLDRKGVRLYEIVIGGWANTQSVLRKAKQGGGLSVSRRHGLVNCRHFRRFYVSWNRGVVKVGEQRERAGQLGSYSDQPPFLSYTDPSPFPVHQVFVSGWYGQSGTWRIDTPQQWNK